jgi:hypothetical protein
VVFEVNWAAKYAEVGETWFVAKVEMNWGCRVCISVNDIFGRESIDNVNGICMDMVKEGSAMAGSVEQDVGSVVNFMLFCFTDAIHVLVFRGCSFNFDSKVCAS